MRVSRTWRCRNCGHQAFQSMRYPKIGASETPLWKIAARGVCRRCRSRNVELEEDGCRFDATGRLDPDQAAAASASLPTKTVS